jgi:nitrogen fixation/metabolism regulation signal transduction histidine kinase
MLHPPGLWLRLVLLLLIAVGVGASLQALLWRFVDLAWLRWAGLGVLATAFAVWAASWQLSPLHRFLRALQGAVLNYRDGDYSMSLAVEGGGELRELLRLHHELGGALRDQRQQLAQRELLLDTLVQHTPLALLLVDPAGQVQFANLAARQLLAQGRSLRGTAFAAWLDAAPAELANALREDRDQLVSVPAHSAASGAAGVSAPGGSAATFEDESYLVSQRVISLLGQPHRLILLRRLTRELSRQEVASWKRVIRVISHELNNSLAPISSLAHSGAELVRRGDLERLPGVLASIGQRSSHLHSFLAGYAEVAKLPAPRWQTVPWAPFVASLQDHCRFVLDEPLPDDPGCFDPAQIEQALLNLVKNAHESGSPADAVHLSVSQQRGHWQLSVSDAGPGMSEAVLAQALLPFYSTKRSGSGLGLALAREITEAHGGQVRMANREGGGLQVGLLIPLRTLAGPAA